MIRNSTAIQIGDLHIDAENHTVTKGSSRVELNGLSLRLLLVLAEKWPNAVGRRDLVHEVWGGTVVSDDALRQRVRLLRRSLGGSDYVEAVKGFGYRLGCPVKVSGQACLRRRIAVAASLAAIVAVAYLLIGDTITSISFHDIKHSLKH